MRFASVPPFERLSIFLRNHHCRPRPSSATTPSLNLAPHFMPSRPTNNHQNKDHHRKRSNQPRKATNQYGISGRHHTLSAVPAENAGGHSLLGIPNESLTHITSFLDPSSLFSLALTNRRLHGHITDDNTWHRAYAYQFLGILPEDDLRHQQARVLMLRRVEGSWRREFLLRWDMTRRWERSRNAAITHVPHHSPVTAMLMMPTPFQSPSASPAILASSLQYGVVSRSYLLTGKVLRGYLDANGTLNGLGVGNPNAEFSPDLVICALSAEGGTAKILWGFRNGTVAVTTAAKAMEGGRPVAARWVRCSVDDAHEGMINHAIWANGNAYCVTGGADGRVKLWDAKRVACIWTSELRPGELVKEACLKVVADLANGVVIGMTRNGEAVVWSGFTLPEDPSSAQIQGPSRRIRVPAPKLEHTRPGPLAQPVTLPSPELKDAHIHCQSPTTVSILFCYTDHSFAYRSIVDLVTQEVIQIPFGDPSGGAISTIQPVFASKDEEFSFVLIGDSSGCVSIYPWDRTVTSARSIPVQATRKLEAHEDGAVTALAWSPIVLVTGSAQGSVKVWDSLSLAHLRSFSPPVARPVPGEWEPVTQIIVSEDLLVMSFGSRVMAWLAGPVSREKPASNPKRHRAWRASSVAKWHQQVEMCRDIAESRRELEYEQAHSRRTFGRQKEQHSTLASLGLSESEALEYVLMLSRDEEEARRQKQDSAIMEEEGLLVGEFDDIHISNTGTPEAGPSSSTRIRTPLVSVPSSAIKVPVSPRFRPEPMEAGLSPGRSTPGSMPSSYRSHTASAPAAEDFPSISSTPSTSASASTPPRRSVSGSLESTRSAWSTPLRMTRSEGPASPIPSRSGNGNGSGTSSPRMGMRASALVGGGSEEEEDRDLRYAIELSLAEARSRGEGV